MFMAHHQLLTLPMMCDQIYLNELPNFSFSGELSRNLKLTLRDPLSSDKINNVNTNTIKSLLVYIIRVFPGFRIERRGSDASVGGSPGWGRGTKGR